MTSMAIPDVPAPLVDGGSAEVAMLGAQLQEALMTARIVMAQLRDCMPTIAEQEARQTALIEWLDRHG